MEKKVVHYRKGSVTWPVLLGSSTYLFPLDHPDTENVSNTRLVRTSKVIAVAQDTGRIETLNTVYLPELDIPVVQAKV